MSDDVPMLYLYAARWCTLTPAERAAASDIEDGRLDTVPAKMRGRLANKAHDHIAEAKRYTPRAARGLFDLPLEEPLRDAIRAVELHLCSQALVACDGLKAKAAEMLRTHPKVFTNLQARGLSFDLGAGPLPEPLAQPLRETLRAIELRVIREALDQAPTRKAAAKLLRTPYATLTQRMQSHGLLKARGT